MIKDRSLIDSRIRFALVVFGIVAFTTIMMPQQIHAQTDDETQMNKQMALSENLEDDPLAQEILRKIDQTKNQVAEFEQRENRQEEIEENRLQALYIMESNHQQYMKEFVKKFESMSNVKIVWNSNELHYEVTRI